MSLFNRSAPHDAVAGSTAHRIEHVARAVAATSWLERFLRFGYIVRGVIYMIPGVLALRLAFGVHGRAITQTGAIEVIGRQPLGRVLLFVVAFGLAGYALWGVLRSVFDRLDKGHSPGALAKRFGFAMSALAYAGLLAATLRLLAVAGTQPSGQQDWSAQLLAAPFGALLVGVIGVCWIVGSGILEVARGWRGSFERDLESEHMSAAERRVAHSLGRFGTVARGAVFTVVGILLVAAALHLTPDHPGGLDGALIEISRQPYGRVLLAAAALGLIAFGAFSVMCARWMRMHGTARAPR